jgi:hypothetical protein
VLGEQPHELGREPGVPFLKLLHALGPVHAREVEDRVRLGGEAGEVARGLVPVEAEHLDPGDAPQGHHQVLAQEPLGSGDEDLHRPSSLLT